ncbi:MAG: S8 family serine peptidase [Candidatus Sericytochromatia bacterium]|nr:S8 family serine peptidase [Candidatus Sericytochromatia bacterium]
MRTAVHPAPAGQAASSPLTRQPSAAPSAPPSQAAWQSTRPAPDPLSSLNGPHLGTLDPTAPPARIASAGKTQPDTSAYLLRVADTVGLERLLRSPAFRDSRLTTRVAWGEGWLVRVEPPESGDTAAWRQRVNAVPEVRGLVREGRMRKFTEPDLPRQWAHATASANTREAWTLVSPASQASIVVAVLDSGLDVTHPEFAGRVVTPFNALDGASPTSNVTDESDGHGTHVTGIVGADGQNAQGGAGVAWGVRILPIKVLGPDGGTDTEILRGFMHAVNWRPSPDDGSRVRVINMSLGKSSADVSALYTEATAIARAAGILVVASSGNDAAPFVASPANSSGVLAVGSAFHHATWEGVSAFSNGGARLDLVAPGEEIYATLPGGAYGYLSGTSMASPYVAGVAALVTARYDPQHARANGAFVDLLRQRLLRAVTDLGLPGRDDLAGEGRLDAGRAVRPATIEASP